MKAELIPYKLNIPMEIKRHFAIEAAKNMRSLSAEILKTLKERMERDQNEKTGQ